MDPWGTPRQLDIAASGRGFFAAATDRTWFDTLPLAALRRWLATLLASDLFARTMVAHPQWAVGDKPIPLR